MSDPISRLAYLESLGRSFVRAFAPWSQITPEEWAQDTYRLPNGGRFSFDYAPYTRAMFRSLFDKTTIETCFQMYSRGLKSTVILLAIGWLIDQAPRRILSLWPTNSNAEKFSTDNLCGELLDSTPCLNFLGSKAKKRTGGNTMLAKKFPGGRIDLFGANAPGDMRRAKGSFLYADEIDAIKTEETDEGDQLAIFNKRGDEYPDTIKVFASYPALKLLDSKGEPMTGHSRINSKLLRTDENQWFSTCVACGGEPFVMRRAMIQSEKDRPETARLECPRCHAMLNDDQRYAMAHRQGFDCWRQTREFRGHRGFQGNALLWPHPTDPVKCPGGALQMIAQQQLDAEKSDNVKRSLRVLVNTVDAEPFDPTDESEAPPEWKPLYEARENYIVIPAAASYLTAFGDIQQNRIEVGWRAWGRGEEGWGMDHVVLDGYVRDREVWCALARELGRAFPHEKGGDLTLGMAFVDGGAYAENVYRFFQMIAAFLEGNHPLHAQARQFFAGIPEETIRRVAGHCRASKGVGKHGAPVVAFKMSAIAKNLKGHEIGTWEVKDRIYARLRKKEHGPAFLHFNQRYGEGFFQQLVVEKVAIEYDGGQEIRKYENEGQARNEALDIEVGNYAALMLRPRNWDMLEAAITEAAEFAKSGKEKPAPEPWMTGRPPQTGWL